jgi:hypothetical protein
MIRVIDDFLLPDDYKTLYTLMMGSLQPWVWNSSHVYTDLCDSGTNAGTKDNQVDYPQLVWAIYRDDNINDVVAYKAMKPLLDKIEWSKLLRVKCNLNIPFLGCDETKYGFQHKDTLEPNAMTSIYYVNDSDGDTVFLDKDKQETRVPPKGNRFVMFPADTWHCGNTPKKSDRRVVINLNWIPL